MSTFGGLLKELRIAKGISMRKFAEALEISPSFLSDVENDRRLPFNSEKNSGLINKIIQLLELDEYQSNTLKIEADKALLGNGMVAKDFEEYMKNCPKAQIAMRKAIDKNISDERWEEVMKLLEG